MRSEFIYIPVADLPQADYTVMSKTIYTARGIEEFIEALKSSIKDFDMYSYKLDIYNSKVFINGRKINHKTNPLSLYNFLGLLKDKKLISKEDLLNVGLEIDPSFEKSVNIIL